MADIMVKGPMATVEIDEDFLTGDITARCIEHSISDGRLVPAGNCAWTMTFYDWRDAMKGPEIEAHADNGEAR